MMIPIILLVLSPPSCFFFFMSKLNNAKVLTITLYIYTY